jgi:hypothetical protein
VQRLRTRSQHAPAPGSGVADWSGRKRDTFADGKQPRSLLLPKTRNAMRLSKIFMPILVLKKDEINK